MAIKKLCRFLLFSVSLFLILPCQAQFSPVLGQTLQINTRFSSIIGAPTWLLIIRDMDSGQVMPYLFDITETENFWVIFTIGRSYEVTVSNLKFGPYAIINNFCHLEDGIISGKSMWIRLSGELSPNRRKIICHVMKYRDMPFPVVVNP